MSLGREAIEHRFGFHPGTGVTIPKHEKVRAGFMDFAEFLDLVLPDGEAKDMVIVKLQEASMWSNFAVAEMAPVVKPDKEVNNARRS